MEKVITYRKLVKELLEELASIKISFPPTITEMAICDEKTGHYLLFTDGWFKSHRYYGCSVHIQVTDSGRVWLLYDGTDYIIADMLVEKGIPQSDIVLGFLDEEDRPYTEFAVA